MATYSRPALAAVCALLLMSSALAATSLYKVLNVEPSASKEEITKAFRRLSREWHPDKNPSPDATAKFQEIAEAYAILSDDAKREEYDRKSFLYDIPQIQSFEKLVTVLLEAFNQHPLVIRAKEIWSSPPHRGLPEVLKIVAASARLLAGKVLPGSSSEAWAVAEHAMAEWLDMQANFNPATAPKYPLLVWWGLALFALLVLAVFPFWPALALFGHAFVLSYWETLRIGTIQTEVPEASAVSGLAALHILLVTAVPLGAAWALLRATQIALGLGACVWLANVVAAVSTPVLYFIMLQAFFLTRLIIWNPMIGLPGPLFLMAYNWQVTKRLPYFIFIKAVRPAAIWAACMLFSLLSIIKCKPVAWKGHSRISFVVATTYRVAWELPIWAAGLGARWLLFSMGAVLAGIPWYCLLVRLPESDSTDLADAERLTTPDWVPLGTAQAEGSVATGQYILLCFRYFGPALAVAVAVLNLWLYGLPFAAATEAAEEASMDSDEDGKREQFMKDMPSSAKASKSGLHAGGRGGAVKRR